MRAIARPPGISIVLVALATSGCGGARPEAAVPAMPAAALNVFAVAEYSRIRDGQALLVYQNDSLTFEQYQNGFEGDRPHRLASATTGLVCAIAAAAMDDGLLSLDERASRTITEWNSDRNRRGITVRQLLNLTSGLEPAFEIHRDAVGNKNAYSLAVPMRASPGRAFIYGPASVYVFGEIMRRKLASRGESVDAYLARRVLTPIGVTIDHWRRDAAGNPQLPTGAFLTAADWGTFGRLIEANGEWNGRDLLSAGALNECFRPSRANPAYGLGFWLGAMYPYDEDVPPGSGEQPSVTARFRSLPASAIPEDVIISAGAGKQRLYVIPSHSAVVVRFGEGDESWRDADFLTLLFSGR